MPPTNVQMVNPLDFPGWDAQILRLPNSSFFHSSAWARVLHESYGYTPLYFTIFEGDAISACLPVMEVNSFLTGRRGVSLPFTDFCEPLASDTSRFKELFDAAAVYGRTHGWKYLELRGGGEFLEGAPPSSTYLAHTLDLAVNQSTNQPVNQSTNSLSSPSGTRNPQPATVCNAGHASPINQSTNQQVVFGNFRDSTRRNIKKSSEASVTVQILTTEDSVRDFYGLNQATRREHGLPPQPHHFFEKVYEHVIAKGYGFVAVAFYEDVAIAASVYFHFGTTAVYKYGASDKQYQHLRANNLVMWEAIRWLCGRGFSSLHFGRTDLDHAGLRQFKTGWGATESKLSYYRYNPRTAAFDSNGSRTSQVHTKLFRRMPMPVLNLLGSVLYKHMG